MDSVSKAEPTGTSLRHQPPRTWHTKLKRIALICLISALLLLLLPGASGTWFVHCTLPQTSGTLTVGGLQHRISVERDLWGVPHIAASTLHDVMFAQGYVTAQDRLFQMELNRRIAQGQLAQTFDPPNYNQVTVPSMREIIDLSNLDNSLWIITTGESGQPFSAHYNDLNPLWNKNQYQQMDFSSQIGK